jgi:hypothetical protein
LPPNIKENTMSTGNGACITVGQGGVGESGASSFQAHTVSGPTSKIIVVRNTQTSLCPNTGAVALLIVDGLPAASGDITALHSSIQAEAAPGARIAAIVHTIPRFNRVVCVRLGELEYNLDECDLVTATANPDARPQASAAGCPPTRDWYAWNNLMPPRPDDFHIVGEVQVANPGVDVLLVPKVPQGINPKILLMDLVLVQRPGIWPQIVVWKQARYDKVNVTYDNVQIFCGTVVIADLAVDTVV